MKYELTPYEKLLCKIFENNILLIGLNPKTRDIVSIFSIETERMIEDVLKTLKPMQESILRMNFGLKKTAQSSEYYSKSSGVIIAKKLEISSSWVYELIKAAIKNIKQKPSTKELFNRPIFLNNLIDLEHDRKEFNQKINTMEAEIRLSTEKLLELLKKRTKFKEKKIDKLSLPIKKLDLPIRAKNVLNNRDIKLVVELVQKTEKELLGLRNFSHKSLYNVKECLANMGLYLNMDLPQELVSTIVKKSQELNNNSSFL